MHHLYCKHKTKSWSTMCKVTRSLSCAGAGDLAEAFPPSSPSRDDGSPKIQEAVTPNLKRLTRSALKKAASDSAQKVTAS